MPYDSTDYVTKAATFTDLKSEFAPLPEYTQTTVKNESWVNVTVTTEHPDGSKSQVFFIEKK